MIRGRRMLRSAVLGSWLPITLLAGWWYISAHSVNPYFPPLQQILDRLVRIWVHGGISDHLLPSLNRFAVAYVVAVLAGLAIGATLWRLPVLATALHPVIYFLYVLPSVALLPVFMLIFGLGAPMMVAIIIWTAVWPVLLNTVDGLRATDTVKLDLARSMNLSGIQTLRLVVIPSASPQIFAGMRTALQYGVILMVVSEFAGATEGIGYFILHAQQTYRTLDMWTGVLILGVVGSILNFLFIRIERRILRWHYHARTGLSLV